MNDMKTLLERFPHAGRIEWLGVRPARNEAVRIVETIEAQPGQGLIGDRYNGRSGKREVTLIQAEHLPVIQALCPGTSIQPEMLRRNIVVSGINLLALKGKRLRLGENVIVEITGLCAPCSKMEVVLGPGGYNVMRGHGGVTARVVHSGIICLGDTASKDDNSEDIQPS
ncbi:MOSC domain-containing protein [Phytohalomonas tamaricis]|uniref:MOSC domain-containing protein n=1 Tax=Phytohalomonas tamaricis TaxID=2081032 RepID=UPI000D0B4957|nr:MOSC domain-containing protein [Phytohalomonas tamaricis]